MLVLAVLGTVADARAQGVIPAPSDSQPPDRYVRHFTDEQGLPSDVVFTFAQDSSGFLWLATAGGLARFGGREFESVRPDIFGGGVHDLATSAAGRLAVVERGRRELWISHAPGEFDLVRRPDGEARREVRWICFDANDVLWVIIEDGSIERWNPRGGWMTGPVAGGGSARFSRAFLHRDSSLLVTGWDENGKAVLWRATGSSGLERLARLEADGIVRTAVAPDGSIWLATVAEGRGEIHRLANGRLTLESRVPSAVLGLTVRGEFVYFSHVGGLEALGAGGIASRLRYPTEGQMGGALLVDREGSLWSATPAGAVQFPEPEAATWGSAHGFGSSHGEAIAVSPAGVWLSTWQGLGLLAPTPDGWRATDVQSTYDAAFPTQMCVDAAGTVWAQTADGSGGYLSSLEPGGSRRWRPVRKAYVDCDPTADGDVVAIADGVVYEMGPGMPPRPLASLPMTDGAGRPWIAADPDDRIHVAWHPTICEARRSELRDSGGISWKCEQLPDTGELRDLAAVEGPDGVSETWLASFSAGVLHTAGAVWRPIPAMDEIEQRATTGLALSPAGGIWAFGFGFVVRLLPGDGGWQIVERLGGWHGVAGEIRSLREEPDGTVWLASWHGVTRVPHSARFFSAAPPVVRARTTLVDGRPLDDAGVVPADHGVIDLRFEASALRDPRRLRYRLAFDGGDDIISSDPTFRLSGVASGDHVIRVSASLDGATWSPELSIPFRVRYPWYSRPWVIAAGLLLAGGLTIGVHRVRTSHLVELERQRTRIAMDLHDELGAGLGSLGILGGLMADDAAPPSDRQRIGEQVARTAAELGTSLHDIVYSLRTGEARVEGLVDQLVTRGRTLFSGNGVRFRGPVDRPVPGAIAPTVSRQAYRIAVEALYNAARHSHASNVRLDVRLPALDGRITLRVEDDGRGIEPSTMADPIGMGLVAMRERARSIGGELDIETRPGGGTRVELRFHPFGRGR